MEGLAQRQRTDRAGTACSAPAITQDPSDARVFVVGCDGKLYMRKLGVNGQTWGSWTFVANPPAGLSFAGKPAAVYSSSRCSRSSSTRPARASTTSASTNNGSSWTGWTFRVTGLVSGSSPAVSARKASTSADRHVYRADTEPVPQTHWLFRDALGGWGQKLMIGGRLCAWQRGAATNSTDVVSIMSDSGLWHRRWGSF